MNIDDPRKLLRHMFDAAVLAAQPIHCLPPFLPSPPQRGGKVVVIGAGKASAAMAQTLEAHWPPLAAHDAAAMTGQRNPDGQRSARPAFSGLVVTRYGHGVPCRFIEIVEAAHPVPDAAGLAAAQRMHAMVSGLGPDDLVIALISGGGSALLSLPGAGLTLQDKQAVNKALLACGATIAEMNCVRRHLSAIKGGRLAAACHPARVVNLLISDVPGDDPINIASGPTVGDPTTCADAMAIVRRYGIDLPPAVLRFLMSAEGESVKPNDPRLAGVSTHLVTTPRAALLAAAEVARAAGVNPLILGDSLEGEARDVGRLMAGMARHAASWGEPARAPCVLLSGGETTVTLGKHASRDTGGLALVPGRGGRNVEFLLSLAIGLDAHPAIYAMAGDTDGVDGQEEVAGALCGPDTLARAWALGIRATESLDRNDGHGFFGALNDAVVTGPTLTNVNDFRAILIL